MDDGRRREEKNAKSEQLRFASEVAKKGKKKETGKVDPKATSGLRKQHNILSKYSLIFDGKRIAASTSHVTFSKRKSRAD